jgi:hypothetical protein
MRFAAFNIKKGAATESDVSRTFIDRGWGEFDPRMMTSTTRIRRQASLISGRLNPKKTTPKKTVYPGKVNRPTRPRAIPTAIRKGGIFKAGAIGVGAVAMLGVSILKGAMNQSRDIVYDRYMQDQSMSKNLLNSTRLGLASGTSRMQNYGSTTGLSNALSKSRHGTY